MADSATGTQPSAGATTLFGYMALQDEIDGGAVIEAAEVPGPTFTHVLRYDQLRVLGESPAFQKLRLQAKHSSTQDDDGTSFLPIA